MCGRRRLCVPAGYSTSQCTHTHAHTSVEYAYTYMSYRTHCGDRWPSASSSLSRAQNFLCRFSHIILAILDYDNSFTAVLVGQSNMRTKSYIWLFWPFAFIFICFSFCFLRRCKNNYMSQNKKEAKKILRHSKSKGHLVWVKPLWPTQFNYQFESIWRKKESRYLCLKSFFNAFYCFLFHHWFGPWLGALNSTFFSH